MSQEILDCKDLKCPMPIVKLSRAFKDLAPGQELTVEANDPAFKADLEAWIRKLKYELISYEPGAVQRAVIRKV
ncbi:MAG: sulfurtransferase TusA family protein [Candidatus Sericytochromatia bacterium]